MSVKRKRMKDIAIISSSMVPLECFLSNGFRLFGTHNLKPWKTQSLTWDRPQSTSFGLNVLTGTPC